MSLLWFILLVGGLIAVHELGHLVAARWCGVRVLKVSIGFGRPLGRFRLGGTEYAIGLVPLGGYVRLLGEETGTTPAGEPASPAAEAEVGSLQARPAWQRLCIIFAGPLANFVFATLVFVQLAHGDAGAASATIGTVLPGQPAADADLRPGDRVLAVDGRGVGDWDDFNRVVLDAPGRALRITVARPGQERPLTKYVTPREHRRTDAFGARGRVGLIGVAPYYKLPQVGVAEGSPAHNAGLRTFDVVTAIHGRPVATAADLEPLVHPRSSGMLVVTYLRPSADLFGFAALGRLEPRTAQIVPGNGSPPGKPPRYDAGARPADLFVRAIEPGTPAAAIGLEPGDELVALDGAPLGAWELLQQALDERPHEEHALTWRRGRDGHEETARLHLERRRQLDEYQAETTFYVLGAVAARAIEPVPPLPSEHRALGALGEGVGRAFTVSATLVRVLGLTLVGRLPATAIGGPILVYQVAGVAAQHGLHHFLAVAALISLNLGLLNLLPVPLLDGGQASLLLLESVRRRPVSPRARERATLVGILLLGALMLLALRNDLARHLAGWWS